MRASKDDGASESRDKLGMTSILQSNHIYGVADVLTEFRTDLTGC